jgi:hypothetical protein
VYHTRSASGAIPSAADFGRLVRPADAHYYLQVSCEYFGDSLGIFGARGHSPEPRALRAMAREIELAAGGHARCLVKPPLRVTA